MTNWTELKRLADIANEQGDWFCEGSSLYSYYDSEDADFITAVNPKTILALIAENERLNEELSACTESPGGCGYWREATRHRESERDQLRAEVEALRKVFAWTPSDHKYDPEIHHNPDAKAWADLFVSTFPGLAEKHDLMLGWFANAMMAMHDFLAQRDNNDLESMRKYAERYLYLRSCHWNDSPLVVVRNPKQQVKLGAYCPSGNLLDDAIDAEIARTNQ